MKKLRIKTEGGYIDAERFIDGLIDTVRKEIQIAIKPLLEQGKYAGTFQKALNYRRGNLVTHGGALWVCLKDTQQKPGTSDDWQLAVKAH